ncbi:MAG: rod shape-determining protein RodA [Candidatus Cloacimonadota bacterium]|nr:rod shape-determining protein RodA [Candidatus Cloacimonadota bacterium]
MTGMKKFDWATFILLAVILLIGVLIIFTASTQIIGDEFVSKNYYIKQSIWIAISLLVLYFLLKIPYTVIDTLILPLYIINILMLITVLFLPAIKGAQRWFQLGPISFQPSELAKILTILLIAKSISKPNLSDFQILARTIIIFLIPAILILAEPDLGTVIVMGMSVLAILAASNLPMYFLILLISPIFSIIFSFSMSLFIIYIILLVVVLYKSNLKGIIIGFATVINTFIFFITPILWNGLKEYQQNRILTFLNPLRDPLGSGYQIIQSKIAIGSGTVTGKGFLMGTQKNLNFLPEHHTDFIFSVIGEEFGFFGCLILLTLYFLFLIRMAHQIRKLKHKEMYFTAVGIITFIAFQAFVNIGMNIGLVPTTGIPLPFLSYGGSNLLINVIAVGLVLKFIKEQSIFL